MKLPWKKNSSTSSKIITFLALICLAFSITNVLPLSASLALLLGLVPLLLYNGRTQHRLFISLFTLLAYFLISTLIYSPASVIEYSFYRRDGNVFITYAPLLLLSLLKLNINIKLIVRKFIIFSSTLNIIFLVVYAVTGGTLFFYEPGIYVFLFVAHNAAGGFLATISALSIGFYCYKKERLFLILSLGNLAGIYFTDSRGSILALLLSWFIVLVMKGKYFRLTVAVTIIFQIAMLSWLYLNAAPNFLTTELGAVDSFTLGELSRGGTFIMRGFYLWPRAIYLFLHSPLFGTGFGSYNDRPYSLQGIPYIFQLNSPTTPIFSDAHAHHSFLHILAETGIIGFILLFYFLKQVRRSILDISLSPLRIALHLAYWVAIISSLTEHRLFTPSQMLPFTIILGLAVSKSRYDKSQPKKLLPQHHQLTV